ncbi:MAG: hypothetical protein ABH843_01930 [Candidatus Omnitrophota bacterium]
MDKKRLSQLVIYAILWSFLFVSPSFTQEEYPLCQSKEDIEQFHGTEVRLIGTYKHVNAGKCWVAKVAIKDGASVVIGYQPSAEQVEEFNDKPVIVIGKILKLFPEEFANQQWLLSPHLVDVKSIEEYTSNFQ